MGVVSICRHIFNLIIIMKLLVVLAVVGVANCASLFGTNLLDLENKGSLAVHAATAPVVTSYSAGAVASPLLYNVPAVNPITYNVQSPIVSAPITYSAPTPIVYSAPQPVVYRAPTPVVYHAPAPAPVVVQAPPQVVVKTVQAPAPAPIVKTVYVPVDDSAEDEDEAPTVYTAAQTTDDSDEEDVATVYAAVQTSEDSEEDK